jgi:hypothetical protein
MVLRPLRPVTALMEEGVPRTTHVLLGRQMVASDGAVLAYWPKKYQPMAQPDGRIRIVQPDLFDDCLPHSISQTCRDSCWKHLLIPVMF